MQCCKAPPLLALSTQGKNHHWIERREEGMNGDGASMKGSSEESKRLDLDRTREEGTTDESRIIRRRGSQNM